MTAVKDLDPSVEGKRIRVVGVAMPPVPGPVHHSDTKRLLHQEGLAEKLGGGFGLRQLWVRWDNPEPGNLMLAHSDEVEVLT